MKWLIFVGGTLFLAVAVIALIGALLPVKHYAARRARFRRTPGEIYTVLAGPPDWRLDVKASRSLPPVPFDAHTKNRRQDRRRYHYNRGCIEV